MKSYILALFFLIFSISVFSQNILKYNPASEQFYYDTEHYPFEYDPAVSQHQDQGLGQDFIPDNSNQEDNFQGNSKQNQAIYHYEKPQPAFDGRISDNKEGSRRWQASSTTSGFSSELYNPDAQTGIDNFSYQLQKNIPGITRTKYSTELNKDTKNESQDDGEVFDKDYFLSNDGKDHVIYNENQAILDQEKDFSQWRNKLIQMRVDIDKSQKQEFTPQDRDFSDWGQIQQDRANTQTSNTQN
ncbi:MAG: hypothetical protein JW867_08395, partial [Candidatus Omnitrophica bacterium]|nr:hypothetical protein [Candidatus Omnitrophota bacterium]